MALADLTSEIRAQAQLPRDLKGAAIAGVRPGSPADEAGLQPGDVVVQVNRKDVASAEEAVADVHAVPTGKDVLLLVWSRGGQSYRVLHPDQG